MDVSEQDHKPGLDPEYNRLTNKFFRASLLNIPIFAVPAFLALFVGKFLDKKFSTDKFITLGLLVVALVLSWVVVLRNKKKLSAEMKKYQAKIKSN